MAISHHSWKVYSRSKGQSSKKAAAYSSRSSEAAFFERAGTDEKPYSAVAAAAYASRSRTWDTRYVPKVQDYSRKTDHYTSMILAPAHAPAWVYDRQKLWSAVEEREDQSNRRATAQLFRGTVLALPRELTIEQNLALLRAYFTNEYVSLGMIADINVHLEKASDGGMNPHAHVMLTMRDIGPDGFGNKRRDWNDVDFGNKEGVAAHHRAKARKDGFMMRRVQSWADYVNRALAEAGSTARISHLSLKDQGVDRLPQPKLGKAGHAKRGQPWVEEKHAEMQDVLAFNRAIDIGIRTARTIMPVARALLSGNPIMAGVAVADAIAHVVSGAKLHRLPPGIMRVG
jgi:hypothetical protein